MKHAFSLFRDSARRSRDLPRDRLQLRGLAKVGQLGRTVILVVVMSMAHTHDRSIDQGHSLGKD
jgi:hypothetical protein